MSDPLLNNRAGGLVWLLCGGPSSEHAVSLSSGTQVAVALATGSWQVRPVVIDRARRWRISDACLGPDGDGDQARATIAALSGADAGAVDAGQALERLQAEQPAVAFLALHGAGGEDGVLQGMLEWHGARYTGSGPAASALAMDKVRSQVLLQALGFRIPAAVSSLDASPEDRHHRSRHRMALAALARERLRTPLFVKPGIGGSSLGVTRVTDFDALDGAIEAALDESEEALIEQAIVGRELTCGVIERTDGQGGFAPLALPVTEISPVDAPFFDYEAKYTAGATREITPAPLDVAQTAEVQRLALEAHVALGCRGMSRSDFMMDAQGHLFILELNTIPGMTPTSLLPQAAEVAGLSFADLCETIIAAALDRAGR